MKKQHWSFAIVVLACLAGVPRLAQAEEARSVPNIEGKWTGKFKLMHWTGPAEQSLELRVFKQDGPLIKGEKTWHIAPGGTAGNVGGKKRMNATESLVGVIGFDNGLYLAEQGGQRHLYRPHHRSRYARAHLYRGGRPGDRLSGGVEESEVESRRRKWRSKQGTFAPRRPTERRREFGGCPSLRKGSDLFTRWVGRQ